VNRTVTGARSNAVRGVDRAAILAEQRSNSSRIRRACNRTHAPTAWPATRSPATPYIGPQTQAPWSHQCATHASKAYLGPRTRGVNCSRYAPQHPPSTLPKMHANPETVETITVNERVSMQEVVRGCGSSGRKEDPMQRRFRQDPMLERVLSGPHAG